MPKINRDLSVFCTKISNRDAAGNKTDKVPSVRQLKTTVS